MRRREVFSGSYKMSSNVCTRSRDLVAALKRRLCCCVQQDGVQHGSPIKREDPPNLSILLSGGKESNNDGVSKGD